MSQRRAKKSHAISPRIFPSRLQTQLLELLADVEEEVLIPLVVDVVDVQLIEAAVELLGVDVVVLLLRSTLVVVLLEHPYLLLSRLPGIPLPKVPQLQADGTLPQLPLLEVERPLGLALMSLNPRRSRAVSFHRAVPRVGPACWQQQRRLFFQSPSLLLL